MPASPTQACRAKFGDMAQDVPNIPNTPPSTPGQGRVASRWPGVARVLGGPLLAGATLLGGSPPVAAGPSPAEASQAGEAAGTATDTNSEIRRYCTNVAVAAGDARFAWQTRKLAEIEGRITARVQDLEARTSALRAWMAKRELVEKQANEKLVGIYAKMRPETAAIQIAGLDDDMAAAVLSQLNPGKASAIFNELVPERATKLAALIAANPAASAADGAQGAPPAGDKAP